MMLRRLFPIALVVLAALPAAAHGPRRKVEAHSHGEGKLAIAIDGNRLQLELESPASDIVGFEHAPKNAGQSKALADAKEKLAKGDALFVLAPAAACKLSSASVEGVGALAEALQSEAGKSTPPVRKGDEQAVHSELKATYLFECAAPDRLGSIGFDYFKAFKGADRLDVTVIGPKGQSSFAVTRKKPVLDLAGLS